MKNVFLYSCLLIICLASACKKSEDPIIYTPANGGASYDHRYTFTTSIPADHDTMTKLTFLSDGTIREDDLLNNCYWTSTCHFYPASMSSPSDTGISFSIDLITEHNVAQENSQRVLWPNYTFVLSKFNGQLRITKKVNNPYSASDYLVP